MLLADAAQAVQGKLYVLGGGWSITGPGPTPMAIAIKVEVPWDHTNRRHTWSLELIDEDGQPVLVPTPEGEQAIKIGGEFEVGRPPGLPPGTPIDLPLVVNLAPLPLPAGQRLEWRLTISEYEGDWRVAFMTRPATPPGTRG